MMWVGAWRSVPRLVVDGCESATGGKGTPRCGGAAGGAGR